jgi:hypothetical protein
MLSRGARAERQANLRLLESGRLEIDEERKQLEQKHAALPALTPAQAEEVLARIHAMSSDEIAEYFQDHPVRMAGKNSFYYVCGDPREKLYKDDPELSAAVEAVNLSLNKYDDARLDLRIAELFTGRLAPPWSNRALVRLDLLQVMISATKAVSFYESLHGRDLRTVERENFKQLWMPRPPFSSAPSAEQSSQPG